MKKKDILVGVFGTFVISLIVVISLILYSKSEPKLGGDFSLNYRNSDWKFSTHSKKINLFYIGYVKCPDICPMSLSFSAQAFQKLTADDLNNVQLLFLSVDAKHDTPSSVADYSSHFFKDFIGLTGSTLQIDFVVNLFNASYLIEENPKSYLGYSIAHTDKLFFLNSDGIVIDVIRSPRSSDEIYKKIKEYL